MDQSDIDAAIRRGPSPMTKAMILEEMRVGTLMYRFLNRPIHPPTPLILEGGEPERVTSPDQELVYKTVLVPSFPLKPKVGY